MQKQGLPTSSSSLFDVVDQTGIFTFWSIIRNSRNDFNLLFIKKGLATAE